MPQHGSLYADGTIHNRLKEEELMLMIKDEHVYEMCLEPKNATDISINQAADEYCVSVDTVRRAIHNGQISDAYLVKTRNGSQYFFSPNSANKLWRSAKKNDNSISTKESTEINKLEKEIIYLKKIINAIINLKGE